MTKTWKDLSESEKYIAPDGYVKPEKRQLSEAELEARRDEILVWIRSYVDAASKRLHYEEIRHAFRYESGIGVPNGINLMECIAAVDKERDPEKFVVKDPVGEDEELIGGKK